ncbi:MAG TPA: NHL repeat-containing protein [Thermoanaerobaculia bacterium]|nr:NHL repeat-containing protein [Thermoanaerobaculia bacterium]
MRIAKQRRALLAGLCLALALAAPPAAVQAAFGDPLFVYSPAPPPDPAPGEKPVPPPSGYLNGPCGLGVDSGGRFYVSDYYHHAVDVFDSSAGYLTQLALEKAEPLDGPCALAFDASDHLYLNNFHRNVVKFNPSPSFGTGTVLPLPAEDAVHHLPTGLAVDPATGNVYVNHRTYISVYDSSGAVVMDGPGPLKIGLGTLGDGYGLAISQFPATLGRLYVPDAATDTVKVYDPALDKVNPVAVIDGAGAPANGFTSLTDAAIAVDRVGGEVYLTDNTQPLYTETPQATVDVFSAAGAYQGHLKYNVSDALPAGLAVDNSALPTQGRVYVSSGNTNHAAVYAYLPGSATTAPPLAATQTLAIAAAGSGSGEVTSRALGIECAGVCEEELPAGAQLTLTAAPAPGSSFAGWSGAGCGGAGGCVVQMDEAASVSARFEARPAPATVPPPAAAPVPQPAVQRRAHHHHRPHHRAHHHKRRAR